MEYSENSKRTFIKSGIAGIVSLALSSPTFADTKKSANHDVTSNPKNRSYSENDNISWEYQEKILSRIREPIFPNKKYNIADYGAKSDGDISKIINDVIEECSNNGGGTVVVPGNTYYCGPITLRSNICLHLSDGAVIKFLVDPTKYPNVLTRWEGVECLNYSPLIYSYKQKNIAITGNGVLDGQSSFDNWWAWNNKKAKVLQKEGRDLLFSMGENNTPVEQRVFGKGYYLRPCFIQPYLCENILISDVKIINSPMWELNPVLSKNIIIRNVKVDSHGPNNDGCDPESCQDVLIEGCEFNTGDDCIAIKSGRNNDGRRVNVASDGIIIRDCHMIDGHGGVVLGSECSGHIRNVFVENCQMDSVHLSRAVRFKNNAVRGGILENVFVKNVKVGTVSESFLTIDLLYEEGSKGEHLPVVRNINMLNCVAENGPRINFIVSFDGAVIDNINYEGCHFKNLTVPDIIKTSGSVIFKNTQIEAAVQSKMKNSVGT